MWGLSRQSRARYAGWSWRSRRVSLMLHPVASLLTDVQLSSSCMNAPTNTRTLLTARNPSWSTYWLLRTTTTWRRARSIALARNRENGNGVRRAVSCSCERVLPKGAWFEDSADTTIALLPPPPRAPSPELLSSDDEGAPPAIPMTLRPLPHYVPPLPPKHTYLRTTVCELVYFISGRSTQPPPDCPAQESRATLFGEETPERRAGTRFSEKSTSRNRRQYDGGRRASRGDCQLGVDHPSSQEMEDLTEPSALMYHHIIFV